MKKAGLIILSIIWIITLVIAFFAGMTFYWLTTTEIETSKDFAEITVSENELVDYTVFMDIPDEYKALIQIDEDKRKMISLYMQANNLKLSEGTHSFHRFNGKLDNYLYEEFKFEPIE